MIKKKEKEKKKEETSNEIFVLNVFLRIKRTEFSYTKFTYPLHINVHSFLHCTQRHSKPRRRGSSDLNRLIEPRRFEITLRSICLRFLPLPFFFFLDLRSYLNSCKVRSNVRTRGAVDFSTKRSLESEISRAGRRGFVKHPSTYSNNRVALSKASNRRQF